MIGTGLTQVQGLFGRRLIVGAAFPLLAILLAALSVYFAATESFGDFLVWFGDLTGAAQVVVALVAASAVLVVARVLSSWHLALTRLYEGYWPQRAAVDRIRAMALGRQHRLMEELSAAEIAAREEGQLYAANSLQLRLGKCFPPKTRPGALMPTRLGNVFRASELYPYERYGLDAVIIWPRLRPLLPPATVSELTDSQTVVESLLLLRTLAGLFGLLAPIVLWVADAHLWLIVLSLLAWVVSFLSHLAALHAAMDYTERLGAVFDLYRLLLLEHVGYRVTGDPRAERRAWDELTQFYFRNLPLPVRAAAGAGGTTSSGSLD